MSPSLNVHTVIQEGFIMSNPKRDSRKFNPNHIGMQPRGYGGNKGKKMQSNTGGTPQVIQTKGE